MSRETTPVPADYGVARKDPEEIQFLRAIPWVIDAGRQPSEPLIKGLQYEASRFRELPRRMRFSLLTPMSSTPPGLLREMILSVRCQSYPDWELLLVDDGGPRREHLAEARTWAARDERIRVFAPEAGRGIVGARSFAVERATGDFLAILDHQDLLHPSALGAFARTLHADPDANLIFSNEAQINADSRVVAHFLTKPPFDLFTLLRYNYVRHLTAIRRDLLEAARRDGRAFRLHLEGAEDHDLFLRVALTGRARPVHVPLFLYYARMPADGPATPPLAEPEGPPASIRMLDDLLPEIYPGARWVAEPPARGRAGTSLKITAIAGVGRPGLLVVVPFQDHAELTLKALDSIEGQEHDLDGLVVLVNNRSADPGTLPALRAWIDDRPRRCRYELIDHDGAFNFARINNAAIARSGAGRDLILFLNNDVELTSPDALRTMAMQLLADPACGFVGIRLMFPGGTEVQHGGVKLSEHLIGSGYYVVHHPTARKDFLLDERISFGVTFACAMTRRETYDRLGGLEEILYPNAFGDVELCARALEAGYRNYYFGSLSGVHHESKSRGRAAEDFEFTALHQRHGQIFAQWRLRYLSLATEHTWPLRVEPLATPSPLPLRHRVADRIHAALKLGLGPGYRALRLGLLGSWRAARAIRTRDPAQAAGPEPVTYRPQFARKRRVPRA